LRLVIRAQFEREVIGERVRDKIAASKRKGRWVGGHSAIAVVPEEAEAVRTIFTRYLELGSMGALLAELAKLNHRRDGQKSDGNWVSCPSAQESVLHRRGHLSRRSASRRA
jgi:DNA invertase Pin-like site-specific DNA recombinase